MDFEEVWRECKKFEILQFKNEFKQFLDLCLQEEVKKVIEIGTYRGGSTFAFLKYLEAEVIAIDRCHDCLVVDEKLKFFKEDAEEELVVATVRGLVQEVDMLFIDGAHDERACRLNYEMWKGLVKKGGIIAFHDIVETEHLKKLGFNVRPVWDYVKKSHRWKEFIDKPLEERGIGVIWVEANPADKQYPAFV